MNQIKCYYKSLKRRNHNLEKDLDPEQEQEQPETT